MNSSFLVWRCRWYHNPLFAGVYVVILISVLGNSQLMPIKCTVLNKPVYHGENGNLCCNFTIIDFLPYMYINNELQLPPDYKVNYTAPGCDAVFIIVNVKLDQNEATLRVSYGGRSSLNDWTGTLFVIEYQTLRSKTVTHTLAALFSSDNVKLAKHNAIAKTSDGTTLWESVKLEFSTQDVPRLNTTQLTQRDIIFVAIISVASVIVTSVLISLFLVTAISVFYRVKQRQKATENYEKSNLPADYEPQCDLEPNPGYGKLDTFQCSHNQEEKEEKLHSDSTLLTQLRCDLEPNPGYGKLDTFQCSYNQEEKEEKLESYSTLLTQLGCELEPNPGL